MLKCISACCFLILFIQGYSQNTVLDKKITVEFKNTELKTALKQIENVSGLNFTYNPNIIPQKSVSGNFRKKSVSAILKFVLSGTNIGYKEISGSIVLFEYESESNSREFHVISGYVEDFQNGERLIGARVYDLKTGKGTLTNEYGFFSLVLPEDSVKLVTSSLGYAIYTRTFVIRTDQKLIVKMIPDLELETIEINEDENADLDKISGVSVIHIPMDEIKKLPAIMGETDALNALKLYPGVQSSGDGTGGLYVRGGGPDQNLILFDGVPIYNSTHLFGFFSIFNGDAVKDVSLVKGGFPARYGGRLSSVIDVRMKDGDKEKISGEGNIGLTAARLMLQGPLVKDQTSFVISARRTVLEPFFYAMNRFYTQNNGNKVGYYFYDVQGKIHHKLSPRDELELSFYKGGDMFSSGYRIDTSNVIDQFDFGLQWGNTAGVLRWNRDWSGKLFSDVNIYSTKYQYTSNSVAVLDFLDQFVSRDSLTTNSAVTDLGANIKFDYLPGNVHYIRFGANAVMHEFRPETFRQVIESDSSGPISNFVGQVPVRALENSVFLEDVISITSRFRVNLGVHGSMFNPQDTTYWSVQPRISARYTLPMGLGIVGSYTSMVQYIHLLSNSGVGLPTDLWVPATSKVRPQNAQQVSMGLEKSFSDQKYVLNLEGYYKKMRNLIDYDTGVNYLGNNDWQDLVAKNGKGESYGLEVFARKRTGRWRGWAGYTWSKTSRQFASLNDGKVYPYKYDRRHDVSIAAILQLRENMEVSATWVYGTGTAITFPSAVYLPPTNPGVGFWNLNDGPGLTAIIEYGDRNSFRLPAYHRLDINYRIYKTTTWGECFLNFGVFNVYNRRNPYFLFLRADYSGNPNIPQIKARKMVLLPILPEFNFGFKF